jgi:chemotaxis signal transduction protein
MDSRFEPLPGTASSFAGFSSPSLDGEDVAAAQARVLAEIAARQNVATTNNETVERQGYRIGALRILATYDATSELAAMPVIYRLPGAPEGVKGLANLHGNVVPVFDLTRWFGVEHNAGAQQMLLVLGHGDGAVGVVIDGLPERKRFSPSDAVDIEIGHPRMARFATAAYRDSTGIWLQFDDRRFFETFARRFTR